MAACSTLPKVKAIVEHYSARRDDLERAGPRDTLAHVGRRVLADRDHQRVGHVVAQLETAELGGEDDLFAQREGISR